MRPSVPKTPEIVATGYAPEHFGDPYWLEALPGDYPRIQRGSQMIVNLVRALIEANLLPAAPRLIDVGAGPGQAVAAFRAAGFDCDGCEFSPSGRRIAAEHFGITLMDGDLRRELGASSAAYDFATCVGVLTMIPAASMPNAMSELARVLRPGGILHVLLLNPIDGDNSYHLTAFSRDDWRAHLFDAGFNDVTHLCDPRTFGLGVREEFCGTFQKRA